jgi:hypothetical protein
MCSGQRRSCAVPTNPNYDHALKMVGTLSLCPPYDFF